MKIASGVKDEGTELGKVLGFSQKKRKKKVVNVGRFHHTRLGPAEMEIVLAR